MPTPQIFTPEFVANMRRKYDRFPEFQRPLVAKIATETYREDDRALVESWIARLDPSDVAKLAPLLRKPRHFLHTYGELAIAQLLLDAQCVVTYERRFKVGDQSLTPDWTIQYGEVTIICDVFTAGLLDDRGVVESATRQLIGRLSRIQQPFQVRLDIPHGFALPPAEQKLFCAAFNEWLRSDIGIGSIWRRNECRIEITGVSAEHVTVVATDAMHIVPPATSITENLREKAKKYGVLGLPLLLAAVKHPDAEADQEMFSDCVLGELVYRSVQLPDGSITGGTCHERGGAFDGRSELSAAYWLNPYSIGRLDRMLIANPESVRQLPRALISSLDVPQE